MTSGVGKVVKLLWAAPCSLVGVLVAAIAVLLGGRAVRASGVLEVTLSECEASSPAFASHLRFRAIALGHVIVAVSRQELEQLRAHELIHVRQYERWGIAFFVAYAASSVWQLLNGRSAYWDNRFEVQARVLSAQGQQEERGA